MQHNIIPRNYVDSDSIIIKEAAVMVDMDCADFSKTSIGTYALGPCIGFIIDVIYDEKKVFILDHYSFLDVDESKLPLSKQIRWFLEYVLKALRNFLIIDSAANIFEQKLGHIFLFVTGGDQKEGAYMRNICSIINANQFDVNPLP
jgi:hypothetical protein